jgi:hypothetical protein
MKGRAAHGYWRVAEGTRAGAVALPLFVGTKSNVNDTRSIWNFGEKSNYAGEIGGGELGPSIVKPLYKSIGADAWLSCLSRDSSGVAGAPTVAKCEWLGLRGRIC